MKKWSFGKLSTAVMLIAVLFCLAKAEAAGCIYLFTDPNAGGLGAGSASAPPVQATFEDLSPGNVRLTLTANDLAPSEFIRRVYFNLNPELNVRDLNFALTDGPEGAKTPRVSRKQNRFPSRGAGHYDMVIRFTKKKEYRFTEGDQYVYTISGIPGLTADDFAWPSGVQPKDEAFGASARIGGTGKHHNRYLTYAAQPLPVPEPSSLTLLGLGGLALLLRRRRS